MENLAILDLPNHCMSNGINIVKKAELILSAFVSSAERTKVRKL